MVFKAGKEQYMKERVVFRAGKKQNMKKRMVFRRKEGYRT